MTALTSEITVTSSVSCNGMLHLTIHNGHADKLLQCYINGQLVDRQSQPQSQWRLALGSILPEDIIIFAAVDSENADENYWPQLLPAEMANRVQLKLIAAMTGRFPGDKWVVYRSEVNNSMKYLELYRSEIFSRGLGCGGFGSGLCGAFGYDGPDAPGYGESFGYGEFGYDCRVLSYTTPPLANGDYVVYAMIDNGTTQQQLIDYDNITIASYPTAAADLSLTSYDSQSNVLRLGFTSSAEVIASE